MLLIELVELLESVPDTDYGYWVDPMGRIYPVPHESHEDVAWHILETTPEFMGADPDDYLLVDILLDRGWIRMVADFRNVEIETGNTRAPTERALSAAARVIRDYDSPRLTEIGINQKRFVNASSAIAYLSQYNQKQAA